MEGSKGEIEIRGRVSIKKRTIVTAVGLALALGLAGCGSSAPKSADSSTGGNRGGSGILDG